MGLMYLFKRKPAAGTAEPTAVDYVEWLLQHMLNTSKIELTIDTSRPLPGSVQRPGDANPPPPIPAPAVVINRLKILSGVNPFKQAKAVEGTFERPRKHVAIIATCRFQDDDAKSTCSIRLCVRGLST